MTIELTQNYVNAFSVFDNGGDILENIDEEKESPEHGSDKGIEGERLVMLASWEN